MVPDAEVLKVLVEILTGELWCRAGRGCIPHMGAQETGAAGLVRGFGLAMLQVDRQR
jgi:hypothetical protein